MKNLLIVLIVFTLMLGVAVAEDMNAERQQFPAHAGDDRKTFGMLELGGDRFHVHAQAADDSRVGRQREYRVDAPGSIVGDGDGAAMAVAPLERLYLENDLILVARHEDVAAAGDFGPRL